MAIQLRTEFGLSIFDIGVFNWIIHELMGIQAGGDLEDKLGDEAKKNNSESRSG